MDHLAYFVIRYRLRDIKKSFCLHSVGMSHAQAWHMAAVNAGYGNISANDCALVPVISISEAKQLGITDVEWQPNSASYYLVGVGNE